MTAAGTAFPREEYVARVGAVQREIGRRGLDGLVLFGPNNLFYLSGYETIGYSNFQFLAVTASGEPRLLVRELESAPARAMSWLGGEPVSYEDDGDPMQASAALMEALGLARGRVGIDLGSMFLTVSTYGRIQRALPEVRWEDGSGIVERVRAVKSPLELECFRQASRYTTAGMRAALEAVGEGAMDNEVGAAAAAAMYGAGSEYVASGPTVTTGRRSGIAHTTFARTRIGAGDAVLVELGGLHHRYTTALMRSAVVGPPSDLVTRMYDACSRALDAAIAAIRPGVTAGSCHDACQRVIDEAGFEPNFRKRLGYSIGVGFAPGWGEGAFLHLSRGDPAVLEPGMVFHMPPALRVYGEVGVGCSETVVVTGDGVEVLTDFPRRLAVR
ncbi:MAG TPA: Xaa-Pro peptidase family protein [Candidatus Dormibacteraeota bacterium]|jgi:Xaa-Pro dipeptidase|nr:Xaa-Pro peptidase family protein [Candidatus Dormibacteraeota bacterium]